MRRAWVKRSKRARRRHAQGRRRSSLAMRGAGGVGADAAWWRTAGARKPSKIWKFVDRPPNVLDRHRLAGFGTRDHRVAHLIGGGRGKEVEPADRNVQIRNVFEFAGQLMHVDEVFGCLVGPPKLAFQPRQPSAVADLRFAIDQPAADLDHVADDALAQRADGPPGCVWASPMRATGSTVSEHPGARWRDPWRPRERMRGYRRRAIRWRHRSLAGSGPSRPLDRGWREIRHRVGFGRDGASAGALALVVGQAGVRSRQVGHRGPRRARARRVGSERGRLFRKPAPQREWRRGSCSTRAGSRRNGRACGAPCAPECWRSGGAG